MDVPFWVKCESFEVTQRGESYLIAPMKSFFFAFFASFHKNVFFYSEKVLYCVNLCGSCEFVVIANPFTSAIKSNWIVTTWGYHCSAVDSWWVQELVTPCPGNPLKSRMCMWAVSLAINVYKFLKFFLRLPFTFWKYISCFLGHLYYWPVTFKVTFCWHKISQTLWIHFAYR